MVAPFGAYQDRKEAWSYMNKEKYKTCVAALAGVMIGALMFLNQSLLPSKQEVVETPQEVAVESTVASDDTYNGDRLTEVHNPQQLYMQNFDLMYDQFPTFQEAETFKYIVESYLQDTGIIRWTIENIEVANTKLQFDLYSEDLSKHYKIYTRGRIPYIETIK